MLLPEGVRHPGSRAAIVLDIFKVATVCVNCPGFMPSKLLTTFPVLRLVDTQYQSTSSKLTGHNYLNGQQRKKPRIAALN